MVLCFLAVVVFVLMMPRSARTEDKRKAPDAKFLLGFFAGDYRLIGQEAGSGAAYTGRVTLRPREGRFEVVRRIAGVTAHGIAQIETSMEGNAVLRMRFTSAKIDYEGTYLWHSDLDNYPRLTGCYYRAEGQTKSPGLEAMFHIPPTPEK